jgi:hypothetical protein
VQLKRGERCASSGAGGQNSIQEGARVTSTRSNPLGRQWMEKNIGPHARGNGSMPYRRGLARARAPETGRVANVIMFISAVILVTSEVLCN